MNPEKKGAEPVQALRERRARDEGEGALETTWLPLDDWEPIRVEQLRESMRDRLLRYFEALMRGW